MNFRYLCFKNKISCSFILATTGLSEPTVATKACYKVIIIIIINIIIIIHISFMQIIYTYIPETNHVPREHCVVTILM